MRTPKEALAVKYMLMFVSDEALDRQARPEEIQKGYEAIGKWWGEHAAAGRILDGQELKSTKTATTIRKNDGKVTVTDGPFIESKEALGGFAIIDVPDLDAAIELAKGWPVLQTIEIRPLVESRDDSNTPKDTR
ncbi:MAG TPA: YciI family protein [Candidatus Limnocylindria bacterium]